MAKKRKFLTTTATLSTLFVLSALSRIAFSADEVLATVMSEAKNTEKDSFSEKMENLRAPDLGIVIQKLIAREQRVSQKEQEIKEIEKALSVAKAAIERQISDMEEAEQRLKATVALADAAAENDLNQLTAVYENMKPKNAAALFEQMDPEFSAGFLGRMRPEVAASIINIMTPTAGYAVSAILAGRNADVPISKKATKANE